MATQTQIPGARTVSPPNGSVDFNQGPTVAKLNVVSGTFTADGTTVVNVADVNVTANSMIVVTLQTPGGTVGAIPAVQTKTAGTGFSVAGTAADTSVYNYLLIG